MAKPTFACSHHFAIHNERRRLVTSLNQNCWGWWEAAWWWCLWCSRRGVCSGCASAILNGFCFRLTLSSRNFTAVIGCLIKVKRSVIVHTASKLLQKFLSSFHLLLYLRVPVLLYVTQQCLGGDNRFLHTAVGSVLHWQIDYSVCYSRVWILEVLIIWRIVCVYQSTASWVSMHISTNTLPSMFVDIGLHSYITDASPNQINRTHHQRISKPPKIEKLCILQNHFHGRISLKWRQMGPRTLGVCGWFCDWGVHCCSSPTNPNLADNVGWCIFRFSQVALSKCWNDIKHNVQISGYWNFPYFQIIWFLNQTCRFLAFSQR